MKFLGLVLLLSTTFATLASPLPDFPFVTVSGESSSQVSPDVATIRLQALVFDKKAANAQEQLTETTANLVTLLEQNDIALNKISSDQVRKRAKRARNNKSYEELEILGYELSQQFTIEVDDITKYPVLSNELAKMANVVGISSQFDVSNKQDIEIELIAEAGMKARIKAKQMAAGLGVKLGDVFAINDTGSFQTFFATFGLESESYGYNTREELASTKSMSRASFIPEYIEISKRVNVVYRLD